jgi:hypothetical protein
MTDEDRDYHRMRAQQCRALAAAATDPDVRRHEELAELHASQAAEPGIVMSETAGRSPA